MGTTITIDSYYFHFHPRLSSRLPFDFFPFHVLESQRLTTLTPACSVDSSLFSCIISLVMPGQRISSHHHWLHVNGIAARSAPPVLPARLLQVQAPRTTHTTNSPIHSFRFQSPASHRVLFLGKAMDGWAAKHIRRLIGRSEEINCACACVQHTTSHRIIGLRSFIYMPDYLAPFDTLTMPIGGKRPGTTPVRPSSSR